MEIFTIPSCAFLANKTRNPVCGKPANKDAENPQSGMQKTRLLPRAPAPFSPGAPFAGGSLALTPTLRCCAVSAVAVDILKLEDIGFQVSQHRQDVALTQKELRVHLSILRMDVQVSSD
ncbi:hypothetical protein [Pseudomonas sp. LRF_L74]|uniref:hypothetical protein n=1 Tax=Pseudomonas sp. LRF_L74 TaxID=3369422 RepID=UPI003F643896